MATGRPAQGEAQSRVRKSATPPPPNAASVVGEGEQIAKS